MKYFSFDVQRRNKHPKAYILWAREQDGSNIGIGGYSSLKSLAYAISTHADRRISGAEVTSTNNIRIVIRKTEKPFCTNPDFKQTQLTKRQMQCLAQELVLALRGQ